MKPFIAPILLLWLLNTSAFAQSQPSYPTVSVSVRHLDLSRGERVVSFQIALSGAVMQDVVNLPVGWNLTIDNNASWQTNLNGQSIVGAAALNANEIEKLRLTVKKDASISKFTVSGVVSATKDWEKFREIPLKADDFVVSSHPLTQQNVKQN